MNKLGSSLQSDKFKTAAREKENLGEKEKGMEGNQEEMNEMDQRKKGERLEQTAAKLPKKNLG